MPDVFKLGDTVHISSPSVRQFDGLEGFVGQVKVHGGLDTIIVYVPVEVRPEQLSRVELGNHRFTITAAPQETKRGKAATKAKRAAMDEATTEPLALIDARQRRKPVINKGKLRPLK